MNKQAMFHKKIQSFSLTKSIHVRWVDGKIANTTFETTKIIF